MVFTAHRKHFPSPPRNSITSFRAVVFLKQLYTAIVSREAESKHVLEFVFSEKPFMYPLPRFRRFSKELRGAREDHCEFMPI
jgi:hypothetical protein